MQLLKFERDAFAIKNISSRSILLGVIAYFSLCIVFNIFFTAVSYISMKCSLFGVNEYLFNESFLCFLSLFAVNLPAGFVVGMTAKQRIIQNCTACSFVLIFIGMSQYSFDLAAYLKEWMVAYYSGNIEERYSFTIGNEYSFYWLYFTIYIPSILLGGYIPRIRSIGRLNKNEIKT